MATEKPLDTGPRIRWASADSGGPGPSASREQPNDWQILRGVDFVEQACRSTKNPVGTPSAIGRTAIQKRIGGYRKELPHTADLEMWLRFAANGAVGLINTCQAFYREHGQNMSVPYYRQGVRDIQQRLAAFESVFKEYGTRLQICEEVREQLRMTLSRDALWTAYNAFERQDLQTCRECLAVAGEAYPSISSWPEWSRMKWKLRFGPRLSALLSFFRDRLWRRVG